MTKSPNPVRTSMMGGSVLTSSGVAPSAAIFRSNALPVLSSRPSADRQSLSTCACVGLLTNLHEGSMYLLQHWPGSNMFNRQR